MRFIYHNILLLLLLSFFSFVDASAIAAFDELPPRMWQAKRLNINDGTYTTIYLLGITHLGLPAEYDDYFRKEVLPAFLSVDTFSFEGAGGRENEDYPKCDGAVLDGDSKKILDYARIELLNLTLKVIEKNHALAEKKGIHDKTTRKQRKMAMQAYIGTLDEYSLIETQNIYANAWAYDQEHNKKKSAKISPQTLKGSIVDVLRHQKPSLAVRDIDSKYGIRRAYCNLGKERINFLKSQFRSVAINSPEASKMLPEMHRYFYHLLSDHANGSVGPFGFTAALDKTFICQRNQEWLNDIQNSVGGKAYFLAVGASHLFKVMHDDARCGGLLDDLTEAGWDVRMITKTDFIQ